MMSKFEFNETQRFRVWWAWLGVISLNILFIYAIVQQVFLNKPFGSNPASDGLLIMLEVILLLLLIFLISIRLKTKITDIGLCYRFYPMQFHETCIEWHELKDAYMREYNSFYEYGGWGIRLGNEKTGRAINTSASSNKGLQLTFSDGKLLLIGTKRPGEIKHIIEKVMASGKINRAV